MDKVIALNGTLNEVFDEFLCRVTSSSLSSGTSLEVFKGGFLPPTNISQTISALNYRFAKLYMGCSKKANKPDISRQWFVYYSYRNPKTLKLERQPPIYREINTFETIGARREYGKAIVLIINELLRAGFSPYKQFVTRDGQLNKNILNCAEFYLSEKKLAMTPKGFAPYKQHVGYFIDWVKKNHFDYYNIDDFKRYQIVQFLSDYRLQSELNAINAKASRKLKPAGNRMINNIKGNLSTFFNYFKTNFEDDVKKNPVSAIKKLPYRTEGNKAYTDKQIRLLKELMMEHEPRIFQFCEMVYESCTRPHEETRLLKVVDLEFDLNRVHIRPELSKEGRSEYIPMSSRYMNHLKQYVEGYDDNDYLFSVNRHLGVNRFNRIRPGPLTPGKEPISQWTLRTWYKGIKDKAGLDETWSIYSWTHSYCVRAYLDTKDVYFIQMKKRHTLLSTTCNYLRGLGLFVDLNQLAEKVRGI